MEQPTVDRGPAMIAASAARIPSAAASIYGIEYTTPLIYLSIESYLFAIFDVIAKGYCEPVHELNQIRLRVVW